MFILLSFIFYACVLVGYASQVDEWQDLILYYEHKGGQGGLVKLPTALRPVGTHTATNRRQAFESGVMEAGLPGVKDVQKLRRYKEGLGALGKGKSMEGRWTQVNRTESAFDLKNQSRAAAYNLQNHLVSFLGQMDERLPLAHPKNESAMKQLYRLERSQEALVSGIRGLHRHADVFEERYAERGDKKLEQHHGEMMSFLKLAQKDLPNLVLRDEIVRTRYEDWKKKNGLKQEISLDRARLTGAHIGEATNFAYDASVATVLTLASGGSFAGPVTAGISLHGVNRVSNALLREVETKKIRELRYSPLGDEEKTAAVARVKTDLGFLKDMKDVAISAGQIGAGAVSLGKSGGSGASSKRIVQKVAQKWSTTYGLYKNAENALDASTSVGGIAKEARERPAKK